MGDFVDLEVGNGTISLPGCISAMTLNEQWNYTNETTLESPVVFYFGHLNPNMATEQFKTLTERLSSVLKMKTKIYSKSVVSIDATGSYDGLTYRLLLHQIEAFECDLVIVIGQEKMYSRLMSLARHLHEANGQNIEILKIPRSIEIVIQDLEILVLQQNFRLQYYLSSSQVSRKSHQMHIAPVSSFDIYSIIKSKNPAS